MASVWRWILIVFSFSLVALASPGASSSELAPDRSTLPWLDHGPGDSIARRFAPPPGFERVAAKEGSFATWLRRVPLLPGRPNVKLFDGSNKGRQDVHAAVIDLDVDPRDLQQCADAVMRLWAEYSWAHNQAGELCFSTASGYKADYKTWRRGHRPPRGRGGPWTPKAKPNSTYKSFRQYLLKVFGTANTASLTRQLVPVEDPTDIQIGDVFIQPAGRHGYGHAVLVMDVVENEAGARRFLISQSYMPAQQSHILLNPKDPNRSPWYAPTKDGSLETPEWSFPNGSLMRFEDGRCPGR